MFIHSELSLTVRAEATITRYRREASMHRALHGGREAGPRPSDVTAASAAHLRAGRGAGGP